MKFWEILGNLIFSYFAIDAIKNVNDKRDKNVISYSRKITIQCRM
jgi:hypothetical protein